MELRGWPGNLPRRLAQRISDLRGVLSAEASPATRRVLIRYRPEAVDESKLLSALARMSPLGDGVEEKVAPRPTALVERREGFVRARISIRGLERNQRLATVLAERLGSRRGVRRVSLCSLTSRVLVEFDNAVVELDELIADVADVEPVEAAGDPPDHPLDPERLIEGGSRLVGAGAGLLLLGLWRAAGKTGPPVGARGPAETAAVLGIVEGFPPVREGLHRVLGPKGSELLFVVAGVTTLALSGSTLGLVVSGAGALRLFTEARARRQRWLSYQQTAEQLPEAVPGARIRIEGGERAPLAGEVVEGGGTAEDAAGRLVPIGPGLKVASGMRLHGGPFLVELAGDDGFELQERPEPPRPSLYDRYLDAVPWLSLGYAVLTGVVTRSARQAFIAFVVVNPRAAASAAETADLSVSARLLRAGTIVVGTRRTELRQPDVVLVDGARLLFAGRKVVGVEPAGAVDANELLSLAGRIAAAVGHPWPRAFPGAVGDVDDAAFEDGAAYATVGGKRYRLAGDEVLELSVEGRSLGRVRLQRRAADGVDELVDRCRRQRVTVRVVGDGATADAVRVVGLETVPNALEAIREAQRRGDRVMFVSDSAHAARGFSVSDLAVGVAPARSGRFAARVDLLAPDLGGVADIVDATASREAATRDGTLLTLAANAVGSVWALRTRPHLQRAAYPLYLATLAGQADAVLRLRGGRRPGALATLADPRPERWGRARPDDVLRSFESTRRGLTAEEARRRLRRVDRTRAEHPLLDAGVRQLASPLTAMLGAGAALSYAFGTTGDVAVIAAVIALNSAVGAWQEHQATEASQMLARRASPTARVRREGVVVEVSAADVVPGDVLMLASGDRIGADARLLSARQLEVDEAALTGESLPVPKLSRGAGPREHVVLAGSDVVVGTGEAVVVGVGAETRLGATAAALEATPPKKGALERRLGSMLNEVLPISIAGGVLVVAAGMLWRRPLVQQLAVGSSVAIAALPEGLPLLAGVAEASVARRLAGRNALVRRLSAVEALGRIDTACVDKTGTLTEGRLRVRVVANLHEEAEPESPGRLRDVLEAAALASPHPDSAEADAHPTDRAVLEAAEAAGLAEVVRSPRTEETQFDPSRGFSGSVRQGKVLVKGAAEVLVPSCVRVRDRAGEHALDEAAREHVLARAETLAARGLRVLLVAEGAGTTEDPSELTVLGFVGISDPLRAGAAEAVERCRAAGIRVVMLTGDHPATAAAVGREAGLATGEDDVIAGAELDDELLDQALEKASVIARVTPFDKVWIIERLQARGHVVAMTGDGVNDAPALRLADVGVAMGRGGTDVAAEAADLVLTDDDFPTLVAALIEGRGFWRNIRRALGLLLGGNLGEIGLMVGATVLGQPSPLTARQVLAVNLLTDVLPAIAVAVQEPEERDLESLAREGLEGLGGPLRNEALLHGLRTAAPSLAAFLVARLLQDVAQARVVGLASIVGTQLAQSLRLAYSNGRPTRGVTAAAGASAALVAAAVTLPPLRRFFALARPSALSVLLVGCAVASAYADRPWLHVPRVWQPVEDV